MIYLISLLIGLIYFYLQLIYPKYKIENRFNSTYRIHLQGIFTLWKLTYDYENNGNNRTIETWNQRTIETWNHRNIEPQNHRTIEPQNLRNIHLYDYRTIELQNHGRHRTKEPYIFRTLQSQDNKPKSHRTKVQNHGTIEP